MANVINYGYQYKTKVAKGNIGANILVSVTKTNHEDTATVKDKDSNEEEYDIDELMGFGYFKHNKMNFDIVEDHYGNRDKNKDVLIGRLHITPRVRSSIDTYRFWQDCLYSGGLSNGYDYKSRELTDQEVTEILLEDILYGLEPNLHSVSLVGTTKKGIDADPNYRNGHYFLENGKDYTMTWCYGKIIIREGRDGGWYAGKPKEELGREIYCGEMDWKRYQSALIKSDAIKQFSWGPKALEKFPDAVQCVIDVLKYEDKYKLNEEFNEVAI